MNQYNVSSRNKCRPGNLTRLDFRPGIAKDKLVFIIISSAAIAVAVVTLVLYLVGGGNVATSKWQCLKCDSEFSRKTLDLPPMDCPHCDGRAVKLDYRVCHKCNKEILVSRRIMTEDAQAQRERTRSGGGEPPRRAPWAALMTPMDIQYRIKLDDGSYGWTQWMPASSPQAEQFNFDLRCPECGQNFATEIAR